MLWAFVCRLDVGRSRSGGPRVVVRVPLGSRTQAFKLQRVLEGGRVRGGAVEFEGRELPRVAPILPEPVRAALGAYVGSLRKQGGRGYKLLEEERHEQWMLARRVQEAWDAAIAEEVRP